MHGLTITANLVEYEALDDTSTITTVLSRSELEEALGADESTRLWIEVGQEGGEELGRLAIELAPTEIDEVLRRSTGDDVVLALDAAGVASLLDDPDVEAHGLRAALAIAVTSAAILAPAGQAAVAQTAETAATAQRVGAASTSQQVGAAATTQVSSLAAKAQVSSVAARSQVSKSLALKGASLKLLRSGLVR